MIRLIITQCLIGASLILTQLFQYQYFRAKNKFQQVAISIHRTATRNVLIFYNFLTLLVCVIFIWSLPYFSTQCLKKTANFHQL